MLSCGGQNTAGAEPEPPRIESAAPGLVESGAPSFAIVGTESLGLEFPPTDIRLMPDGRILVIGSQQLALGDGVRWEVFRQAPSDSVAPGLGAAVDHDGQIYLGTREGVARVVFDEDGFWRLVLTTSWNPPGISPPQTLDQTVVTEVDNAWFWHSLRTGAIIAWRPGETARHVGHTTTFEHMFRLGDAVYLSDRVDGALSRLGPERMEPVKATGSRSAITCSAQFDKNLVLVGTFGLGLQLFDGHAAKAFPAESALFSNARINDLCTIGGGYFAAAVNNLGVVLFDHEGRTIQVLDRMLDQRLARVKRLLPGPDGVVWGLLDGGVLRVELPAQVSHFESLIGAGVSTVHPYRLNGRLWWLADGKVYRGSYNGDGRLTQLEADSPPQLFANSFSGDMGLPVVGTEDGAFYRSESGWVSFAPTIKQLFILDPVPIKGRWLYGALNEVGWLQVVNGSVDVAERIPVPALSSIFNNPVKDAQGRIWLELGIGRIGCVQLEQGVPSVKIFSGQDGLPQSWPQIFEFEGTIGSNFSEEIFLFNDALQRFVPEVGFAGRFPGIARISGRVGLDAGGRLWLTAGGVSVFQKRGDQWKAVPLNVPLGFQPYYFTFENDGVVWMHALHRLSRYDPAMPATPPVSLQALITHVNLAASSRSLFALDHELAPLDFSENSLIFHFVARGSSLTTPVTFEVKLEGAEPDWVSAGSAGSAAFSRLKEGRYVLHVRPRSGRVTGEEAALAFSILPPWYRTPIAYLGYGISALGAVLLTAWLMTLLERRENSRLEQLVAERTGELSRSNAQLASQVEEIRVLTRAIVQSPIAVFITRPDGTIEFSNPRSSELTGCAATELIGTNLYQLRALGMTPQIIEKIAAALQRGDSWSGQLAYRQSNNHLVHVRSTISAILSPDGQARQHLVLEEDITEWLADQQRHRKLEAQLVQAQKTESIGTLAGGIAHDFNNILTGILGYCELARMAADAKADVRPDLQQIRVAGLRAKDLVMQILTFSRQSNTKLVPLDLAGPVSEAMKLIRASTPATVEIVEKLESGTVLADATQIHQVMINLCTNAVHAMRDRRGRLEISIQNINVDARLVAETANLKAGHCLRLTVKDNGHGMDQAVLQRIFDPFFTTKGQGEGTGLGLAIVQGVVVSHGGALQVSSQAEIGTTFELYFPRTHQPVPVSTTLPTPKLGKGQEVLLVDDEVAVVEYASSRLKHFGYRPVVFRDPREAVAVFKAEPARFAAVVTDLTMPQLTGLDLIGQIRPLRPSIPVVVLTGYGREATREKLAALPCCVLLQKPFSGEDLAHALSQVMDQSLKSSKSASAQSV